jgi:peptidoglycan/LPS O-acetylase OafA/YrhL
MTTEPGPRTVAAPGRLEALTGLRIVAAALVFLSHAPRPLWVDGAVGSFMASGYIGVTVFFVLSGFVIAWNYTDRLATPSGSELWSYAVARIARIYPLYLFALLVAAAPSILAGTVPERSWVHVLALQAWSSDLPLVYSLNSPGWSIGVELFLYMLFPGIILVLAPLRTRPERIAVVAVGAVVALAAITWWFWVTGRGALPDTDPSSAHRWLYRMPAMRVFDFVLGICAAMLARSVSVRSWLAAVVQIASLGVIVVLMTRPAMAHSVWSWDLAYMVPSGLLIWSLAVGPASPVTRVLGSKPVVRAGEASFAFYLLHMPLLSRLSAGEPTDGVEYVLVTALLFVLVLMMATGAHLIVERPAQRWLRARLSPREAGRSERRPARSLAQDASP